MIPDNDDLMTALVSATEGLSIKLVTQKQLQAECARRGIPRSGTKTELLARLQAHEVQHGGGQGTGHGPGYWPGEEDKFATISTHITLGTPIPSSLFSSPPSSPNNEDRGYLNGKSRLKPSMHVRSHVVPLENPDLLLCWA
jgi:hypothetical protein